MKIKEKQEMYGKLEYALSHLGTAADYLEGAAKIKNCVPKFKERIKAAIEMIEEIANF